MRTHLMHRSQNTTVSVGGGIRGGTSTKRLARILMLCVGALVVTVAVASADGIRGGRLYDRWWVVLSVPAPKGDHPLYPAVGLESGSATFRCKECHGWDYKGASGAYGAGSHFTGIPGVLGSTLTPAEMFDIIKNPNGDGTGGTTVNGHDFGGIGLSDADIQDLVDMLVTQLIDTDNYIDAGGLFLGDEVAGETLYTGVAGCFGCHGLDGKLINFGTPAEPEYVGTVASHNPWEFMHKVRFGQPASSMPSWTEGGGDDQSVADLGSHAQTFPTGECGWLLGDANGDAGTDLADAVYLLSHHFQIGPPPVPQLEVGDVNGDGAVDIADGIRILEYLFGGGAPLQPSPTC